MALAGRGARVETTPPGSNFYKQVWGLPTPSRCSPHAERGELSPATAARSLHTETAGSSSITTRELLRSKPSVVKCPCLYSAVAPICRARQPCAGRSDTEASGDAVPAMQHGGRGVREPLATRRWLSGATLLLFSVTVLPPPARADISGSLRCRAGTVLMRTDSKTCPTERGRPAAAVERACCQRRNGKVRCMPYPQCPTRSPS